MKKATVLVSCTLLLGVCANCHSKSSQYKTFPNIIEIKDASKPYTTMMHLNRKHFSYGMKVLENTINDTAKVGRMNIPPGKIGNLYRIDNFEDSIPFRYFPYKAKKGRLVIQYYTTPY